MRLARNDRALDHLDDVTSDQIERGIQAGSLPDGGWEFARLGQAVQLLFTALAISLPARTEDLSGQKKLCDDYDPVDKMHYFDRDPDAFRVLQACYKGVPIHLPRSMCPIRFMEEQRYWGLQGVTLDQCCYERTAASRSFVEEVGAEVENRVAANAFRDDKDRMKFKKIHAWTDFRDNISKLRWMMWTVFSDPGSSLFAKMWAVTSIGFIVLSLMNFFIGTLQSFQEFADDGTEIDNPVIAFVEKICIMWFTLEYCLRLMASPDKLAYIRQVLNLIDLATIVPYYIQLYFTMTSSGGESMGSISNLLQVFRVMRVMRVFRLGRHSAGLQVLVKTFIRSSTELALLSLYFVMGIILLATLEYSMEEDKFAHLGEAFWWATITVTTVGYGDICPVTVPGKLIASLAFMVGILAIGLPIHPIIANFTHFYKRNTEIEYALKRTVKRKDLVNFLTDSDESESAENTSGFASASGDPKSEKNVDSSRIIHRKRRRTYCNIFSNSGRPGTANQASVKPSAPAHTKPRRGSSVDREVSCSCVFCKDAS